MSFKELALIACLSIGCGGRQQVSERNNPQITNVTDETFEREVLQQKKPVIVDFYTTWCPSCQYSRPAFEELSSEHKELKFAAYDCGSGVICDNLDIHAIPTYIIFKNGEENCRQRGFSDEGGLEEFIEDCLE